LGFSLKVEVRLVGVERLEPISCLIDEISEECRVFHLIFVKVRGGFDISQATIFSKSIIKESDIN
jgi:hypothetical protein